MQSGASSIERLQFRLTEPQKKSDKRITPIRGDLADIKLAGTLFAPHYAEPKTAYCIMPSAMLLSLPNEIAVSQISYGEKFAILDISGQHAWGYSIKDGYVGYVPTAALNKGSVQNTHQISSRSALIFSEASIKSTVVLQLPMGAQVKAQSPDHKDFIHTANGFIHKQHLTKIGETPDDSTTLARALIGAPYLWGGRNGNALDCSGLVQLVLGLQGIESPRDSDMQQILGTEIAQDTPLQRNDIIFFPGHVGIMTNNENLIHANAHWMQVKEEPLADVIARIKAGGVIAKRRL